MKGLGGLMSQRITQSFMDYSDSAADLVQLAQSYLSSAASSATVGGWPTSNGRGSALSGASDANLLQPGSRSKSFSAAKMQQAGMAADEDAIPAVHRSSKSMTSRDFQDHQWPATMHRQAGVMDVSSQGSGRFGNAMQHAQRTITKAQQSLQAAIDPREKQPTGFLPPLRSTHQDLVPDDVEVDWGGDANSTPSQPTPMGPHRRRPSWQSQSLGDAPQMGMSLRGVLRSHSPVVPTLPSMLPATPSHSRSVRGPSPEVAPISQQHRNVPRELTPLSMHVALADQAAQQPMPSSTQQQQQQPQRASHDLASSRSGLGASTSMQQVPGDKIEVPGTTPRKSIGWQPDSQPRLISQKSRLPAGDAGIVLDRQRTMQLEQVLESMEAQGRNGSLTATDLQSSLKRQSTMLIAGPSLQRTMTTSQVVFLEEPLEHLLRTETPDANTTPPLKLQPRQLSNNSEATLDSSRAQESAPPSPGSPLHSRSRTFGVQSRSSSNATLASPASDQDMNSMMAASMARSQSAVRWQADALTAAFAESIAASASPHAVVEAQAEPGRLDQPDHKGTKVSELRPASLKSCTPMASIAPQRSSPTPVLPKTPSLQCSSTMAASMASQLSFDAASAADEATSATSSVPLSATLGRGQQRFGLGGGSGFAINPDALARSRSMASLAALQADGSAGLTSDDEGDQETEEPCDGATSPAEATEDASGALYAYSTKRWQGLEDFAALSTLAVGRNTQVYVGVTKDAHQATVAIKAYFRSHLGGGAKRHLALERDLLRTLRHPHIVRGFGEFEDESAHYLVQEFAEGDNLAQHIRRCQAQARQEGTPDQPCLAEAEIGAKIVAPMLDALSLLHTRGIVHCDLKPENLVFHGGVLKIIDLGLAIDVTIDTLHSKVGTLHYMSPEVLAPKPPQGPIVAKLDIWGLGIIVWELLTGRTPFHHDSKNITMALISEAHLPWEQLAQMRVSTECKEFLMTTLQRDPEARPSAHDLQSHPWLSSCKGPPAPQPRLRRMSSLQRMPSHLSTTAAGGMVSAVASTSGLGSNKLARGLSGMPVAGGNGTGGSRTVPMPRGPSSSMGASLRRQKSGKVQT